MPIIGTHNRVERAAAPVVPQASWDALEALRARLAHVEDPVVVSVVAAIRAVDTSVRPSGTMRKWMEAHDGKLVHTVQIGHNSGDVWTPVWRMVNTRSTYVLLAGSRRDYRGMHVVFSSDDVLLVVSDSHTVLFLAA